MSLFPINIKAGNPAVFAPNPLTVYVNDSVFWFNGDPKNAHWPAPSASDPTGFMAHQIAPNSQSDQVGFGEPQTIPYICINHKGEQGQIIVKTRKKKGAFGHKTKKGAFGRNTR
jgi:plastocyanin